MDMWDTWKKAFDAWEDSTARYLETVMQSPLLLGPAGTMLTAAFRARAAQEKGASRLWSAIGLPTRYDQERTLHKINELQSKLLDLEDELAELRGAAAHPEHGAQ